MFTSWRCCGVTGDSVVESDAQENATDETYVPTQTEQEHYDELKNECIMAVNTFPT